VCGKAFRQKAHLIKHQQIHKRVGRDWQQKEHLHASGRHVWFILP
jgi:hypothetical protein